MPVLPITRGTRRFGGRLDVTCSSRSTDRSRRLPTPLHVRFAAAAELTAGKHAACTRIYTAAARPVATDAAGIHGDAARGHSRVRRRSHTCSPRRCSALLPRAPGRQDRSPILPPNSGDGLPKKPAFSGAKKNPRDSKESTSNTPSVCANSSPIPNGRSCRQYDTCL